MPITKRPIGEEWEELKKILLLPTTSYRDKQIREKYGAQPRTITDWKLLAQEEQQFDEPDYEELMDLAKREQKVNEKLLFKGTVIRKRIKSDRPIALCISSDWHLGSEGTDYVQFEKDLEMIRTQPRMYCIVGGDGWDNFLGNFGVSVHNQHSIIRQRALYKGAINQIKDKIVAVGTGNHQTWSEEKVGADQVWEMIKKIGLLYTGSGGLIELTVGDETYKVFRHHKYPFNSRYNPTHSAKQMWKFGPVDWDLGVVEHGHLPSFEPFMGHSLENTSEKYAIRTGTYKVYDNFALANGFYGNMVCNPTAILYPDRHKIVMFMRMEDALNEIR